jgi:hypothetical protein
MICCGTYANLGCRNPCLPFDFGENHMAGTYIFEVGYNDAVAHYEIDLLLSEPIIFDIPLNENYSYTARLISPNGDIMCYKFKTQVYVVS